MPKSAREISRNLLMIDSDEQSIKSHQDTESHVKTVEDTVKG